jgi:site-specific DNA recombinase
MRAAIYARVSTDRQGRDRTIDSQLDVLLRWVAEQGHDLKKEHIDIDEGYSGARLDRPDLDRLRDAAREDAFDIIGVCSPDRLARRYAYQVLLMEEFRKAGCGVAFIERPISEDPHDQLLLQIQGAIAEYERAVLGERFRRGKLHKARAGQWVFGRAPYGYRYVPTRDGVPGHLEIDTTEAEVVRMLYGWLSDERMTVRQILKRLAEGPWRPRSGKRLWSNRVVHHILSDPVYTGTAYVNRHVFVLPRKPRTTGPRAGTPTCRKPRPRTEWIPIPVPALIDESTHQAACDQLARNSALSYRNNTRHDYLLRCLLTCRTCGLAMFGITTSGTGGRRQHRYYNCHGKDLVARDRACRCSQAPVKVDELDAAVWGHVRRLLEDPATLAAQFEDLAKQADALDADAQATGQKWDAQLRRLDREEHRLLDAYQVAAIDVDELKQRREQIRGRRKMLMTQRDQEQRLRCERQTAKEVWADLTAFCQRVRSRLDEATLGERQRILQLLIERVIVGPDSLEIRHVIPLGRLKAEPAVLSPTDPHGSGGGTGSEAEGTPIGPGARLRSDGVDQASLLPALNSVVAGIEVGHQDAFVIRKQLSNYGRLTGRGQPEDDMATVGEDPGILVASLDVQSGLIDVNEGTFEQTPKRTLIARAIVIRHLANAPDYAVLGDLLAEQVLRHGHDDPVWKPQDDPLIDDPRHEAVAEQPPVEPGDRGWHEALVALGAVHHRSRVSSDDPLAPLFGEAEVDLVAFDRVTDGA